MPFFMWSVTFLMGASDFTYSRVQINRFFRNRFFFSGFGQKSKNRFQKKPIFQVRNTGFKNRLKNMFFYVFPVFPFN